MYVESTHTHTLNRASKKDNIFFSAEPYERERDGEEWISPLAYSAANPIRIPTQQCVLCSYRTKTQRRDKKVVNCQPTPHRATGSGFNLVEILGGMAYPVLPRFCSFKGASIKYVHTSGGGQGKGYKVREVALM